MRKCERRWAWPVMLLFWYTGAVAQDAWSPWIRISVGMGIGAMSQPSVVDYVKSAAQVVSSDKVPEFGSVTEFAACPEVRLSQDWSVGVDYMYRIKSLTVNGSGGRSQFELAAHHFGIVVHYLIEGEGYLVRLGGGPSLVKGNFSQALYGSSLFSDFSATGGSFKLEAVGDTQFDEMLYGTIGVDLRWVFGETYHHGDREVKVGTLTADLSSFSLGLKLGVAFRF